MHASGLAPRWASAPGETITSAMRERSLGDDELASQLGLDPGTVRDLLAGELPITVSLARNLAATIGGSTEFWLAREAQYADDLARVRADKWSEAFPIQSMAQQGWISRPKDWHERIDACLAFFDVADPDDWEEKYGNQVENAHFRTSPTYSLGAAATAAWFRAADRIADPTPLRQAFDKASFTRALSEVRELTRVKDPDKFLPELRERCARAGVYVVVVAAPDGCPASGAARTFHGRPLIQLSARHLTDDHLWFSFFHEAGHVLLHGLDDPFVDVLDADSQDDREREANEFAAEWLFPNTSLKRGHLGRRDIIRSAVVNGVAPGIIVGQLQHRGLIPRGHFNGLKRRYQWNGPNLGMVRSD